MGFTTEITLRPAKNQKAFQRGWNDVSKLADEISDLIVAGNEQGLLASLDAEGDGMAPVQRKEGGPPLIPHETASRFIKNFKVRATVRKNRLRFRCYWNRLPFLRFHETGTKNMPRRNPSGIRPKEIQLIKRAIRRHFGGASVEIEINTDVRS